MEKTFQKIDLLLADMVKNFGTLNAFEEIKENSQEDKIEEELPMQNSFSSIP
jgi:hypothetical protein